jgi:hypothetical protein
MPHESFLSYHLVKLEIFSQNEDISAIFMYYVCCHSERSEESNWPVRFFAALRMTAEVVRHGSISTLFCQIAGNSRLFDCGRSKAFPYAFFVVKEQLYANRFVADRNRQLR